MQRAASVVGFADATQQKNRGDGPGRVVTQINRKV
jgi:hypothetical protein